MIWLKGIIFFVGIVFLYKAGKQLFGIAKEKQQQQQCKQQVLIQCTKCQTHIPICDVTEINGESYCRNCVGTQK